MLISGASGRGCFSGFGKGLYLTLVPRSRFLGGKAGRVTAGDAVNKAQQGRRGASGSEKMALSPLGASGFRDNLRDKAAACRETP